MSNLYHDDTEEKKPKSFFLPSSKPHYNPDRPEQVNHIFLDLHIDIAKEFLAVTCNLTLTPIRSGIDKLTLDAV